MILKLYESIYIKISSRLFNIWGGNKIQFWIVFWFSVGNANTRTYGFIWGRTSKVFGKHH